MNNVPILCGDQLQSMLDGEKPPTLYGEVNAMVWAREFVAAVRANPSIAVDEATMVGWFANAIMAGYDRPRPTDREAAQ